MTQSPTPTPRSWLSRFGLDAATASICALAGVLISAWPHFAVDWRWVGDQDELYYLAIAERSYHGEPGDPALEGCGRSPYRAAPLWPGIAVASAVGSGPWGVGLAWRVWGGATTGLLWFLVFRHWARSSRILAASAAIFMLAELGALEFRPVVQLMIIAVKVMTGGDSALALFQSKPVIHPQWRIATPCLTLAFLLLHVWLMAKARDQGGRLRIASAGLSLGLLFYVYFYYWTAAVCALGVAALMDCEHRRRYAAALAIGLAAGAWAIIGDYGLKQATSSDWLARTDKFLTIGRSAELHFPKPALFMAGLGLVATLRWRRDLAQVWALGGCGLFLMNHQMATGLQIENFHWKYVAGPMLEAFWLLWGISLIDEWTGKRRTVAHGSAVAVAALSFAAGLGLRHVEATRTREPHEIVQAIRAHSSMMESVTKRDMIAGDEILVDVACIASGFRPLSNYWTMLSPTIDDEEWERRIALNAVLRGTPRSRFHSDQTQALAADGRGFAGAWSRDPADRERRLSRRLRFYDELSADSTAGWDRHPVRWLLLPADSADSPSHTLWRLRESGPTLNLWERLEPR